MMMATRCRAWHEVGLHAPPTVTGAAEGRGTSLPVEETSPPVNLRYQALTLYNPAGTELEE